MGKYFGTDGIRGKAEIFTGDFIERIVRGLGVTGKRVLIGGDTRESTEEILEKFRHALDNNGATEVGVAGVLTTPGINYAFCYLGYDYAIDVTASHNPYTDNGIKIFEPKDNYGVKLGVEAQERIEKELDNNSPSDLEVPQIETQHFDDSKRALTYYMQHLERYVGDVRLDGFKIALDCANGATGVVGGTVFERLGASVHVMNNDTSYGRGINDGVGSTHIEGLQEAMRGGEYHFGAAFDGDGDRCILVDETGEVVDGDQILTILARHLKLDKIVATVMANQGLLNWGKENSVEVVTADVGDQNVAAEMHEKNIQLGGEQSGHIILPGEPMGDGILTALMVAKAMKESMRKLSGLASLMIKSPQVMVNVPATDEVKAAFKQSGVVSELIHEYEERLKAINGRVLVRPSGTEALIRVTMWGDNKDAIAELADELAKRITEELKNGSNS